ncbi:MAG: hypothetical protein Q4G43_04115 [Mobilicoccus sp.]|nr:hypothetical protein [Mobilicoccus sp.]
MENAFAVVAVGPDREGLLAEMEGAARAVVGELHGDPTLMFMPGGNIGVMLAFTTSVDEAQVRRALQGVEREGITITVRSLEDQGERPGSGEAKYVLRVRSMGRPGVIGEFERIVARHGGMIVDFGTRIGGGRIAVLRVDLADHGEDKVSALTADLYKAAEQMGVGIKFYDTVRGEHQF